MTLQSLSVLPLLLAFSAQPSAKEQLFAAIKANDAARVEQLLTADPSLANAQRKDGLSAYLAALLRTDGENHLPPSSNPLVAAILRRHPVLDPFEAAAAGNAARVAVELDSDPGYVRAVQPRLGWTPLHFAAFAGREAVAVLLLDAGAAVDAVAKNKFANNPLQVGLLTGQVGMTRLLLSRGAKVSFRNGEGFTALHEAAGSRELVELLLAAGAEVNARSKDGRTPLDLAIKEGHADAVQLLRARGATEGTAPPLKAEK